MEADSVVTTVGDTRFFARSGPFDLAAIAAAAQGEIGGGDGSKLIASAAPLQTARPDQVSFLDNRRYADLLTATQAAAVIIRPEFADKVPPGCVAITTKNPRLGWAYVAALFHPPHPLVPGIHPSAVIDPSAKIGEGCEIGPFVVIGPQAEIGAHGRLGPGVVIGNGVMIGTHCRIGAHASLSHALVGNRVYIYPGARIGQEGFGFELGPQGFVTVPQLGRVILEDDVEVGANSCVDRGSTGDTVIGAGSRLDNQVQIGHNVRLGRCCVIVAQVGISGSCVFEDFVTVAGQAGFAGHLRIGKGARIGGQAGIMTDVPAGAEFTGSPAQHAKAFFRQEATLRRLVSRELDARKRQDKGTG
jgi:UDP-3-O-[3-hydroxymyristoyl] glucosamine N-acyltransferase